MTSTNKDRTVEKFLAVVHREATDSVVRKHVEYLMSKPQLIRKDEL